MSKKMIGNIMKEAQKMQAEMQRLQEDQMKNIREHFFMLLRIFWKRIE